VAMSRSASMRSPGMMPSSASGQCSTQLGAKGSPPQTRSPSGTALSVQSTPHSPQLWMSRMYAPRPSRNPSSITPLQSLSTSSHTSVGAAHSESDPSLHTALPAHRSPSGSKSAHASENVSPGSHEQLPPDGAHTPSEHA